MASSSSSSSSNPPQGKYDVFISFRGTDTRENILSHLHAALLRKQIYTFIDNDLTRGDDVSEALLRTIEDSKVSIILFSRDFASSRWCLDELVKIMECRKNNGQIVIPVFYHVNPSDVRKQTGNFAEALAKYQQHPNLQQWKEALRVAGALSGWDSQTTRPESTLVEEIVEDILKKLYSLSSSDYGQLVGIPSRIQEIESQLSIFNKNVHILGIWGMGGIGKSTLTGCFFNQNSAQFEGHCFLANVREESQKCGLHVLRRKLLAKILEDNNINIDTPHLEQSFIKNRLHNKKVLVVLDDVNDSRNIEFLCGGHDWFGPGSIVIITSRDKQVLKSEVDEIYEVKGLDYNEALCLFSQYAFKQKEPISDRWSMSDRAMSYAKGNPLALIILGSSLFGKGIKEQESYLDKLDRTPNMDIQKVLQISFDGLDWEEQNIFLDIACFFKGKDIDEVRSILDSSYGFSTASGLANLIDKSLITISNGIIVWMHDLLQEMGREIVRKESIEEPGKRSRLWDQRDICHVLTRNTGTEAIKSISLYTLGMTGVVSLTSTVFARMHKLKFLHIEQYLSERGVCEEVLQIPQRLESLPDELRHLRWMAYPGISLPQNFHPENLVTLEMRYSNNVEELWNGKQNLPHLKKIDLSGSSKLIRIPDLSLATNLKQLLLYGCERLIELHSSVKHLHKLKELDLSECVQFKKFPEVASKDMQLLYLGGTAIEEVPPSIEYLSSLQSLILAGCKMLNSLSSSICNLKCLNCLSLWNCSSITKLPDTLSCLSSLRFLFVKDCRRLQSLRQLPMNVTAINADNCISLEMVSTPFSTTPPGDEFQGRLIDSSISFSFTNCLKLDQNARNSIVTDAELKVRLLASIFPEKVDDSQVCIPGSEIPEWFTNKSKGSSVTAQPRVGWSNGKLFLLSFCAVVDFTEFTLDESWLSYDGHLKKKKGESFDFSGKLGMILIPNPKAVDSNHVFIGFKNICGIEENSIDEISIKFKVYKKRGKYSRIKRCGLHLLDSPP